MAKSQVIGGPAQVRTQMIQPGDIAQPDDGLGQAANFVMKLGVRYAQGQLAQKQQQMFVQGMQRVAQGEALSDIKKDQPEFASIFGDTASVEGAQAMAKVKAVDDFTTKAYEQMPELAKMSPQKAGKVLTEGMSQHLTGDTAVDSVIQARMVEQLPVLMKAQTKANYAWTQNEMSRQYSGSLSSAAQTMQGASIQLARGVLSDKDFDVTRSNAVSLLQRPQGMAEETYRKTILETAQLQLSNGNHWFDRTLRQRGPDGEASFYESVLDPDDQKKLNDSRATAERATAKQYGFNQYGSIIAELGGRAPGMSPAEIQKSVLQINKQYMAETGSESGIIDMGDAMSMVKGSYERSFRLADKASELRMSQALKDQSDAAKALATQQKVIGMLNLGQGKFATMAGADKSEVDQTFYEGFALKSQKQGIDEAAKFVVGNYNTGAEYTNPHVENLLQSPFRQAQAGAPTGQSMQQAQQLYAAMIRVPGGQAAADAYLGADNVIKMQRYNDALNTGMDMPQASQMAFGAPLIKGQRMDTAEFQPILDTALKDTYKSGGANGWFQTPMYEASKGVIQNAVAPIAAQLQANLGLSPEAAVKRAIPMARQHFDVLGPLAVSKQPNQVSLAEAVGTSQDDAGKLAFEVIQRQAKAQGVNIDLGSIWDRESNDSKSGVFTGKFSPWDTLTKTAQVSAVRLPDRKDANGKVIQMYHATAFTDKGDSADFWFDSNDISKALEGRLTKKQSQGGRLNPSVPDYRVK